LKTILTNVFNKSALNQIMEMYLPKGYDGVALSSPPELFNLSDILELRGKSKAKDFFVLYPGPPLGIDELKVLSDLDNKLRFLTPIELSTLIK
jgi:hypothetical protein